jgi:hypothetical protein
MLRRKPLKRTGSLKRTPLKRISERGKLRREEKKALVEEDKEFYMSIWDKRPHRCRICSKYLGEEALMVYFHHILEKRNYKEYRHKEWNIIILCWEHHTDADQNKIELINRFKTRLLYKLEKAP